MGLLTKLKSQRSRFFRPTQQSPNVDALNSLTSPPLLPRQDSAKHLTPSRGRVISGKSIHHEVPDASTPLNTAPRLTLHDILEQTDSKLIQSIRDNVIGEGQVFHGPFGDRRITYADYTASGRSHNFIEDFIRHEVMPLYANTHSDMSYTGRQTSAFRESARRFIHQAVGGSPDDVVIALGSGSTAAVNRMVDVLGLRKSGSWSSQQEVSSKERPVVFIGPFEHHSNELPWRESVADVVRIGEDINGHIDQFDLRRKLEEYRERPFKIGSFSAASNVTGILSDTDSITNMLHQYGALAFWDYATAAPYVKIDMNPDRNDPAGLRNKDAVFVSPHKFVGGPGTPGLLIAKKKLFRNVVPSVPGGGTVRYVTRTSHAYIDDIVHREEGGTPAIIETIRAGLVFQLKEQVGVSAIECREHALVRYAIQRWRDNPRMQILGSLDVPRLAIISFLVKDRAGGLLHHNFVVALLNDLFGIQARGGCSCAGPYGHSLLGLDAEASQEMIAASKAGLDGLRPGWVRLNFNYFISEESFEFILSAVEFVAECGSDFIPQYRFDVHSGAWSHREARIPVMTLHEVEYSGIGIAIGEARKCVSENVYPRYLAEARQLAE